MGSLVPGWDAPPEEHVSVFRQTLEAIRARSPELKGDGVEATTPTSGRPMIAPRASAPQAPPHATAWPKSASPARKARSLSPPPIRWWHTSDNEALNEATTLEHDVMTHPVSEEEVDEPHTCEEDKGAPPRTAPVFSEHGLWRDPATGALHRHRTHAHS